MASSGSLEQRLSDLLDAIPESVVGWYQFNHICDEGNIPEENRVFMRGVYAHDLPRAVKSVIDYILTKHHRSIEETTVILYKAFRHFSLHTFMEAARACRLTREELGELGMSHR